MITPAEESRLLQQASVPEHIVSLMTLISKGEPFLIEDHLELAKDNWLIFIGYPLGKTYRRETCERLVLQAVADFQPEYLWFVGPEIPPSLSVAATERRTDLYYLYDCLTGQTKPSLLRLAERVAAEVTVQRGRVVTREHEELITEQLERSKPEKRVKVLYRSLADYIGHSPSAWLLDARDRAGRLCAFSVLDLAAARFSAYILGAHSRRRYVPHASDLLFREMISMSLQAGKESINLGLGVNDGIRRFKEKWGGRKWLPYEFCECRYQRRRKVSLLSALLAGKRL